MYYLIFTTPFTLKESQWNATRGYNSMVMALNCHPKNVRVAVVMLFAGITGILPRISAYWGEADPSFKRNVCIHHSWPGGTSYGKDNGLFLKLNMC